MKEILLPLIVPAAGFLFLWIVGAPKRANRNMGQKAAVQCSSTELDASPDPDWVSSQLDHYIYGVAHRTRLAARNAILRLQYDGLHSADLYDKRIQIDEIVKHKVEPFNLAVKKLNIQQKYALFLRISELLESQFVPFQEGILNLSAEQFDIAIFDCVNGIDAVPVPDSTNREFYELRDRENALCQKWNSVRWEFN